MVGSQWNASGGRKVDIIRTASSHENNSEKTRKQQHHQASQELWYYNIAKYSKLCCTNISYAIVYSRIIYYNIAKILNLQQDAWKHAGPEPCCAMSGARMPLGFFI